MKKILLILIAFIIVFQISCLKKQSKRIYNNLNNGEVGCFGHGGMGVQWKFPIDCKESILEVLRFGADGSEMDIQLTKDYVLVLFHDHLLEDKTQCSGYINDKTYQEIKDENCRFNSPLSSTLNIISVNDLFNQIGNLHDYTFTFDTKLYNQNADESAYISAFAHAIDNVATQFNMQNNLFVEVTSTSFLDSLLYLNKDIKYFYYADYDACLDLAKTRNIYGITIDYKSITSEQIDYAHKQNLRVTLFNQQDDNANIESLNKNPDYIQSDRITHLLAITDKYKN